MQPFGQQLRLQVRSLRQQRHWTRHNWRKKPICPKPPFATWNPVRLPASIFIRWPPCVKHLNVLPVTYWNGSPNPKPRSAPAKKRPSESLSGKVSYDIPVNADTLDQELVDIMDWEFKQSGIDLS